MTAITPLPIDFTLQPGLLVPLLEERVGKPGELLGKVDGTKSAADAVHTALQDPADGLKAIRTAAENGENAAKAAQTAATDAKAASDAAAGDLRDEDYGLAAIKAESAAANTAATETKSELLNPDRGLAALKAGLVSGNALCVACYLDDLDRLVTFAEKKPDEVRREYDADFKEGQPYRERFLEEVRICFGDKVRDAVSRAHAELDGEVIGSQKLGGPKASGSPKQIDRFDLVNRLRTMGRALAGAG